MATFLKRNKFYTIVYTDKTGRRRWESTGCFDLIRAQEYYRTFIRMKDVHFKMTLEDLMIELEKKLTNRLSIKTVKLYRTKLSLFGKMIGDKPIDKISGSDIEDFMAKRIQDGVSFTTVNIDFRTIKAAFNRAITMGFILNNPCKNIEPYRHPHEDPVVLSDEQMIAIVNAEENQLFKALWMMLYLTAARRGEILYLEWSDIDFNLRTIRLRNKKDHTLKTKKPRTIPLSSIVFDVLLSLPRRGSFIFCKEDGNVYSSEYISAQFKSIIRRLHLSDKYHLHSLRHSAATRLNELGESSFNIQQSLGHSSVMTTQLYIQPLPETLRCGYEKIASGFKKVLHPVPYSDQSAVPHGASSVEADDYKSLSLVS